MNESQKTLVDKWITKIKNNKFLAIVIVSSIIISSIFVFSAKISQFINSLKSSQNELLATDKVRAEEFYNSLSELMGSRLFKMNKIFWGYKNNSKDLDQRWNDYIIVLDKWNANLQRNIHLTEKYFGTKNKELLVINVHYKFVSTGELLEKIKISNEINDSILGIINSELDQLNIQVTYLNNCIFKILSGKGKSGNEIREFKDTISQRLIKVDNLVDFDIVNANMNIRGENISSNGHLWVLTKRSNLKNAWWPQGYDDNKRWNIKISLGSDQDIGSEFEIAIIIVDEIEHRKLLEYITNAMQNGSSPIVMPSTIYPPIIKRIMRR
jgi:hypothetical protein